ncbi:2-C-methyl-D-erythritol 4-phosphate cytidylyltransferase [Variovorax dokdonensis]|uniref:2-C-methyl-D-erythritol 4-phosphate cytidylyltransferase n=1 Tax=Variovorax dokdonensis TaxID=344883 RepID=A0ABT7N8N0_9BURK|nr:2-C-methyl-D-erythritol 4-phosphate cytidylyltransferase [Variovorax dokdonensis]MDM0044289.1 2-C-methyl-D-erythritol 4-phosphate cytidylyltransferase [Variovorax dokdonensis]
MHAPNPTHLHVLIPCAGNGSRAGAGTPKQYRRLAGRPLVAHTLEAFRAVTDRLATLALVVAPGDAEVASALPAFPRDANERLLQVGGITRAASVRNGLQALRRLGAKPSDWVLVHDAARCLLAPSQIEALVAACEHDAVGGLLALRVADTLKAATPEGRVQSTLTRADKWLAQTPQMFRLGILQDALEKAGDAVTDEAGAIEALGLSPLLVNGSSLNIKVTYPEDFELAEAVLRARGSR